MMAKKYYTFSEASRELDIPRTTLYEWVRTGMLRTEAVAIYQDFISREEIARLKKKPLYVRSSKKRGRE